MVEILRLLSWITATWKIVIYQVFRASLVRGALETIRSYK